MTVSKSLWICLLMLAVPSGAATLSPGLTNRIAQLDFQIPRSEAAPIAVIASYPHSDDSPDLESVPLPEGGVEIVPDESQSARAGTLDLVRRSRASGAQYAEFIQSLGATDVAVYPLSRTISFTATRDVIDSIARQERSLRLREDAVMIDAPVPMPGESAPPDWNLSMTGAPTVWQQGYIGSSVVVAVLDTGVDGQHPTLSQSYRGGSNSWFDPYAEHPTPYDRTGHGTQVLGLILGNRSDGTYVGTAPGAQWIAAKVFDDAGEVSESALHAVFEWLLDPDGDPATSDSPDVVNASWGFADEGICDDFFRADIDALRAMGIAVVFSAGNSGPNEGSDVSPANYDTVVSAGALTQTGEVADFSSRGPSSCDGGFFPDLVAPGDGVVTTDHSFGGAEAYISVAGTSFAASHVTGAFALLKDAVPPAPAVEIEAALLLSARDASEEGLDNASGYGLIDIPAALDLLAFPTDADGDGYSDTIDCNDQDSNVYPGAPEYRRDGVDQNCDGFDITIKVHYAVYSHDGSSLRVRATSRYGAAAQLEVVGLGPMTYQKRRGDWILKDGAIDGYSNRTITIRGIEGEVVVKPRSPLPRRSGSEASSGE